MGMKGDKMQRSSVEITEFMVESLSSLEGITSKKMFGGNGLFYKGKMFGMINSKGDVFLKSDDSNKLFFVENGSTKHSKMPYYSVPSEVLDSQSELIKWSKKSMSIIK